MAVATWSFASSFQDWTFEDVSAPAAGGTAIRTLVSGAIRTTMTYPVNPPTSRDGIGNHISPLLNATAANGDTIEMDYDAAVGDSNETGMRITATYTDDTTETVHSPVVVGSGTFTLTLTQSKVLKEFFCGLEIGSDAPNPTRTERRDITEIRLTTVAEIEDFDLVIPSTSGSGLGEADSAFAVSQDGQFLFFAAEEDVSGNQKVIKIPRPTSITSSYVTVYAPALGTSSNIAKTGDPNRMIFHGNFGTDVGVVDHAIVAGSNTDISPTSIGAELIQPLEVDPSDIQHMVAINRNDQDALETEDTGANWATLNAALGLTVDAMALIFLGAYFPFGGFIGGNDGVDENLSYSPNEFSSLRDDASAALKAVAGIVSVDIAPG